MRTLTNPTDIDLFCDALGAIVVAGSTVDVADEVADALADNTVFVLGDPAPEAPAPTAPAPADTVTVVDPPAAEVASP